MVMLIMVIVLTTITVVIVPGTVWALVMCDQSYFFFTLKKSNSAWYGMGISDVRPISNLVDSTAVLHGYRVFFLKKNSAWYGMGISDVRPISNLVDSTAVLHGYRVFF
jgi:hypothetical protein